MATIITSAGNVTTKRTRGGYLLLNDGCEPIGEWTPDGLMLSDSFSGAAPEVASACSKLWSPQPKTTRVRIAVAVNRDGQWHASGCNVWKDSTAIDAAEEGMPGSPTVHFIEATVPLPESVTVEGEVKL